jgi:hypothetical protein
MAARTWSNIAALLAVISAHGALAQDGQPDLTAVGKAILQAKIADDAQPPNVRPGKVER